MSTEDLGPLPGDRVWPGYDNPHINRLRELRNICPGIRFVSAMWAVKDSHSAFRTRDPNHAEVRWMVLAVLGAGFYGLTLEGDPEGLLYYQEKMRPYFSDLESVQPVNWIKPSERQPASGLASPERLFVVMANPEFLSGYDEHGDPLPPVLDSWERQVRLFIRPPDGIAAKHGKYVFQSKPLKVFSVAQGLEVNVNYVGGGDILVFDLESAGESQHEVTAVLNPVKHRANPMRSNVSRKDTFEVSLPRGGI